MRVLVTFCSVFLLATTLIAQSAAPPATDRTKATGFSAAELAAALSKLPTDRPASSARVYTLAPYVVNVERRLPKPQGASVHEAEAELFYVIEGSGTFLTGGKLVGETRNGPNLSGTAIDGGTRQTFVKGDFMMVPSGIAHQFVDLTAPVVVMSIHLPNAK